MREYCILREAVLKYLRFLLNVNFENIIDLSFLVANTHTQQMTECYSYYCLIRCHNKAFLATNRVYLTLALYIT